MKKSQNHYKVDHAEQEIWISRAFARKASTIATPEYKDMKQLMSDFPAYKIFQRENERNPQKVTYANLSYTKMEDYIKTRTGNDPSILQQFENVLKLSKIQAGSYAYVKKWFLAAFPDYRDYCPDSGDTAPVFNLNAAS